MLLLYNILSLSIYSCQAKKQCFIKKTVKYTKKQNYYNYLYCTLNIGCFIYVKKLIKLIGLLDFKRSALKSTALTILTLNFNYSVKQSVSGFIFRHHFKLGHIIACNKRQHICVSTESGALLSQAVCGYHIGILFYKLCS